MNSVQNATHVAFDNQTIKLLGWPSFAQKIRPGPHRMAGFGAHWQALATNRVRYDPARCTRYSTRRLLSSPLTNLTLSRVRLPRQPEAVPLPCLGLPQTLRRCHHAERNARSCRATRRPDRKKETPGFGKNP